MKIYTKTGDQGMTSLYGGMRVSKDDVRIEAYGTVDELNAHIAELIASLDGHKQIELLIEIQNRLFTIGSILASDPTKDLSVPDLRESDIVMLENAMDNMDATLEPLRTFVLPGGSSSNSKAHICRTISRRAERRVISLAGISDVNPIVVKYLNRLSDYFFVLSRKIASDLGHHEVPWIARTQ
ncbi:MAG: cob(I)yrinic acid a,c-diamide adenosyltransferase [Saprospiraceae bacterium]|nr:cob(I)yrinic acid a,c-diamide adenosyltransferase [Saprospiraceae bacterium]